VCSVVAPGGQLTHSCMLIVVLYLPMLHVLHSLPPKPAWQRQSDDLLVPTVSVVRFSLHLQQLGFVKPVSTENFSTSSHSSDVFPNMFLNVPMSQALHASSRHFPGPNAFVLPLAHAVCVFFFVLCNRKNRPNSKCLQREDQALLVRPRGPNRPVVKKGKIMFSLSAVILLHY
jgi:hypothetical protein